MKEIKISQSVTNRNEDSIGRYLMDINRYNLITADEEVRLCQLIKQGDESAKHKLINANLRFGVSCAKQYLGQGLGIGDLIAESNSGLIKAAGKFDDTRGLKFISFAVWWIRQCIMVALSGQTRMIRLPFNQLATIREVIRAESTLEQRLERLPTAGEVAEYLDYPDQKVLSAKDGYAFTLSLDAAQSREDELTLIELIPDTTIASPDHGLHREGLTNSISKVLDSLPKRQKQVIELFFGLSGWPPMALEDIAVLLGFSAQCIQADKKKALEYLKSREDLKLLKEYFVSA